MASMSHIHEQDGLTPLDRAVRNSNVAAALALMFSGASTKQLRKVSLER